MPTKKQIWYDETVSILCSKGISHNTKNELATVKNTNNTELNKLNNSRNVFQATLTDNGNSYLYNILLHYYSEIVGNSTFKFMMLSVILGIGALIAFYFLCTHIFGTSILTSVCLVMLMEDSVFWGMAHEIRAYELGILFVTLSGLFIYRFIYTNEKSTYLFLGTLFAVCAVLSHYLAVYVLLVFVAGLLIVKWRSLFRIPNLIAIAIPAMFLAIYIFMSIRGFTIMNRQNDTITKLRATELFSLSGVFSRSLKLTAISFKSVLPAFKSSVVFSGIAMLFVIGIAIYSYTCTSSKNEKSKFSFFLFAGAGASVFLTALSIISHHYTALYNRYYSFSVPFTTIFIIYSFKIIYDSKKLSPILVTALLFLFFIPESYLHISGLRAKGPSVKYNHSQIADKIYAENIHELWVPKWRDALLVNCFIADNYLLNYHLGNTSDSSFVLLKNNVADSVRVVAIDE